jgi:hypothetical protein
MMATAVLALAALAVVPSGQAWFSVPISKCEKISDAGGIEHAGNPAIFGRGAEGPKMRRRPSGETVRPHKTPSP